MSGYRNLHREYRDKEFLEAKRRFKIKKDIYKALDDEINMGKSIKQLENEIVS